MVRLEKRAYSRDEISAITGVPRVTANGATNKHFRDTVETRLTNWHYEYIVQHGGDFIITQTPTTALDRLHEIMMRELRFDKQVSPRDFAAFLHFMMTVPDADCMPMEERLDYINGVYQPVCLCKSTLERWTASLEKAEALGIAGHAQVRWKTKKINGLYYRTKMEGAEMLVAGAPGDLALDRGPGGVQLDLLAENGAVEEDLVIAEDHRRGHLLEGADRGVPFRGVELEGGRIVLVVNRVDVPARLDRGCERQLVLVLAGRL